ncbi:MAG: VOC family protein, partial [Bryobacteraceae bacterium]
MAKPIPDGYHTLTAHMVQKDAAAAIEFYKQAFGAEERFRMPGPGGQGVAHAELQIGDSVLMLSDEFPGTATKSPSSLGGTTISLFLYVKDVDALFAKATAAGAKVEMPPMDMFWG